MFFNKRDMEIKQRLLLKIKQNYLNQKFFSPMVKVFKRFHDIYIINKDAAISTPVESHTKTLKPLLTSSIPNLWVQ